MTDQSPPTGQNRADESRSDAWPYTRHIARLVLIPTVPMLLLSVAALGLFYIAPTRFGNLIARLPGETFIRTALVFAPATLFAVVVLALLYALERPPADIAPAPLYRGLDREAVVDAGRLPVSYTRLTARVILAPSVLALLFATAIWALSFVSPSRYERLMDPLPGDRYLRLMVPVAPIGLFFIVLVATFLSFYGESRRLRIPRISHPINLAVGLVLITAIPILLFSLAALGLFYISPTRFENLVSRVSYESFVRLALAFTPTVLFAVVLLASLYLYTRRLAEMKETAVDRSVRKKRIDLQHVRSRLAPWVLVGGLVLTAMVVCGLLGAVLYLVLR
jgi:hypothetical protein